MMLIKSDFEAFQNLFRSRAHFPRHTNGINSIFFNDDLSPVRKVISRSNTRATGKWPSWKMGMVHYESENEKNAFKLLDASPNVVGYYAQPCIIKYQLDGEIHTHYPDILVHYQDRKEIWEVKTLSDSLTSDIHRRSVFMDQHLSGYGYQYRVTIAEVLEKSPRLQNVETIIRHGRQKISFQEREAIRQLFVRQPFISWGAIVRGAIGPIQRRHISRLILEGRLVCDINQLITESTLVYVPEMVGETI